ncbi:hypothetical protein BLS_003725 [Venturia inaequalis]|uniref:Uncharacterized protein n=1 Tax=Venturia inaequalis TaxID=5025 RepID=A0A8H3VQS9_VENIN|nr:hypothetical protein BLS_003725 [Venturia inaequalis]KAE9974146.1 hypothetical protein EG328_004006 [Venturia inaequalis]KAE9994817.1 hypothetical protein EG327_000030 [Venturia inaequalis]RDI83637.1 hypothetical protein Vi05172_g6149 [Venturia inaequalis]
MKFTLLFLISLAAAAPIPQFGGGKSFACQHDHLHVNKDCKAGGSGAGSGGGLASILKGAGGGAGGKKALGLGGKL